MTMEVSLALLAFSAPITASIIIFRPAKKEQPNGKYVMTREYDAFKHDLYARLGSLEKAFNSLNDFVRSRL